MLARLLFAALSLALAATVSAQQAAPAAAPATTTAPAASLVHTCKRPGDHPGKLATDNHRRTWAKDANGYLECLKKFAMDQQAIGKPLIDQAKPHIDAANAAVEEHNKAAAALKDEADKNN